MCGPMKVNRLLGVSSLLAVLALTACGGQ